LIDTERERWATLRAPFGVGFGFTLAIFYFAINLCFMSTEKKRKGPARIAERRTQLRITLPDDDLDILKEFCCASGTVPATFIREIVQQSIPSLKILVNASRIAKSQGAERVQNKAAILIGESLSEATGLNRKILSDAFVDLLKNQTK